MEAALDEEQLLIREMNHRIKNNLSLVGATLQARRFPDASVRNELGNAVARINNVRWSTIGFSYSESGHYLQLLGDASGGSLPIPGPARCSDRSCGRGLL